MSNIELLKCYLSLFANTLMILGMLLAIYKIHKAHTVFGYLFAASIINWAIPTFLNCVNAISHIAHKAVDSVPAWSDIWQNSAVIFVIYLLHILWDRKVSYIKKIEDLQHAIDANKQALSMQEKITCVKDLTNLTAAIHGAPGILVITEPNSSEIWLASRYTSKVLGYSHDELERCTVDEIQLDPDEHKKKRHGLKSDKTAHKRVNAVKSNSKTVDVLLGVTNVQTTNGVIGVATGALPSDTDTEA